LSKQTIVWKRWEIILYFYTNISQILQPRFGFLGQKIWVADEAKITKKTLKLSGYNQIF